jgi:hypothetical protein
MKNPRTGIKKARARKKKQATAQGPQVETEIIDVVEEPVPGLVTITEFESQRLIVPESDEGD